MGAKSSKGTRKEDGRCHTEPPPYSEDEPTATHLAKLKIDFEHFSGDPNAVLIAEELAMVSAKVNIEDFKILKLLGKGSYGKVMLVQHKDEGTLYALKTLRKRKVIKTAQIEHTKSERRILEKMEHPFLLCLRYAFQTKAKLYMVFDYICGGELFQHLKNEEYFKEERARFYAAEIFLGLEFLHKRNIVYRDLKPENVLLDIEGHVKIADFGLAKELSKDKGGERTCTLCGTNEYLAPEIVKGEPYGFSVDYWALGILIFEMLTGWAPWQEENKHELFKKILTAPLDLSHPNLSPTAKDLLQKMLAKKIEERILPQEIKKHPFFSGIDFVKLLLREIKPPFKPALKSPTDVSYFDEEFTQEDPLKESPSAYTTSVGQSKKESYFGGFSYLPSESLENDEGVEVNKVKQSSIEMQMMSNQNKF